MKKEEILEASKRENKKKDVYEIEVDSKAGQLLQEKDQIQHFIP